MKAYVGTAKSVPDSYTPRRFMTVMKAMKKSASATRCSRRLGTSDATAKAPAATLTATVRT